MSSLWVVLDTESEKSARRIGRVQESDGDATRAPELTVSWPDGSVERVKLSPKYRKFRLDSLSAMAEFAPDQLAQELESSPLPFARALVESPKAFLKSIEVLKLVTDKAGVEKATVDRAWKKHRKAFESLAQIQVEQSGSSVKYHLIEALPPIELGPQLSEPVERETTPPQADAVPGDEAPLPPEGLSASAPASPSVEPLVIEDPEILEERASQSVDIAEALSMRNLPLIEPEVLEEWFGSDAPAIAMAAGATRLERLRNRPEAHAEELARYSLLASRILKRQETQIPAETLGRAFVALRRSSVEPDRRRGLEAVERLATSMTMPTEFLSRIDLPAFQIALSELPLVDGGARARILVALARSKKSVVEDAGWWRGFTWSDVLDLASGPLSMVVEGSETLMAMVRGVVDDFAQDVGTRRSLAVLLGAPKFALEHFTPEQIKTIFERVAQRDEMFARWHEEISALAEREELALRVSAAEEGARRAAAAEAHATAEREELSAQLAELQARLRALQTETVGLSIRERRQVLIDAAKVVSQVAATVEGDGSAPDHAALVRKVSLIAERFGLQIEARPGESVAFDPSRHSAPGARPEDGEIVNVARAGYSWSDGDERVIVLLALVTRASASEETA